MRVLRARAAPEEASGGCTRSAHPSSRLSPDETPAGYALRRRRGFKVEPNAARGGVWQRGEGPRNISVVAKARVAASERGVPWSAARVHHARVAPLATRWAQERQMVVPWRAARVHHARVMPLATRWAQERQMVCGSGVKSTGAAKSSAPARYWPIMKMRAAVTGTEQSALIWPSRANRAEPASWSGCEAGCMPAWQTRRSRRYAGRWR